MNVALTIILAWLTLTYIYSFFATIFRRRGDVKDWFIAGGKIGLIMLWLSLGANIYSSYTFLGLPGEAARRGFNVFSFILYGMIAYILGYFIVPQLWLNARGRKWLTIADAYRDLYGSRFIEVFVALTASLWCIPYIQLQLDGINIVFEEVGGRGLAVYLTLAVFVFMVILVTLGGLSTTVTINALQGAIMLVSIWFIALTAPKIAFGNYGELLSTVVKEHEGYGFRMIPRAEDLLVMYTTIVAAPLGFWLWPNRVQNVFAAKDYETTRKNMVLTSVFQLSQIPAIIVGFVALGLYVNGVLPKPADPKMYDKALIQVAVNLYDPALTGLICAGVVAASLSTAAALLQSTAALLSRNLFKNDSRLLVFAKLLTLSIAFVSLVLMLTYPTVIVSLLLVGYGGIIQLFPTLMLALKGKAINKHVAVASMSSGMVTVLAVNLLKELKKQNNPIYSTLPNVVKNLTLVYEGFLGLLINVTIITLYLTIKKLQSSR